MICAELDIRGQYYDGASSMSGVKSGVAKRIQVKNLGLFICTVMATLSPWQHVKQSRPMKRALEIAYEIAYEITKLINFSPCRE